MELMKHILVESLIVLIVEIYFLFIVSLQTLVCIDQFLICFMV